MPRLTVEATHRDVGRQIGAACGDVVVRAVEMSGSVPRGGRSMAEQIRLAAGYRDATIESLPWLVEEIDGVAEVADLDPVLLFDVSTEELWESASSPAPTDSPVTV